ncbi:MAG: flagellar basal body rod protein FlgB [Amphiplicatus sp.]
MDLLKAPLLSALAERMKFLAARTGIIAQNIANADTPDYVARDLKKPTFARLLAAPLKTSNPRHLTAPAAPSAGLRIEAAPDPDSGLNGNKVSIETQAMKLSETRMDYQLASTVYRKGVDLIRLAARGTR